MFQFDKMERLHHPTVARRNPTTFLRIWIFSFFVVAFTTSLINYIIVIVKSDMVKSGTSDHNLSYSDLGHHG